MSDTRWEELFARLDAIDKRLNELELAVYVTGGVLSVSEWEGISSFRQVQSEACWIHGNVEQITLESIKGP